MAYNQSYTGLLSFLYPNIFCPSSVLKIMQILIYSFQMAIIIPFFSDSSFPSAAFIFLKVILFSLLNILSTWLNFSSFLEFHLIIRFSLIQFFLPLSLLNRHEFRVLVCGYLKRLKEDRLLKLRYFMG